MLHSPQICMWTSRSGQGYFSLTAHYVTTDNGSNAVKAVEKDLDKVRFPCAGHTLNLSVQKAFEVQAVQKAISRSKKVVEHFNKSRPHHKELENKQEMLELPKNKLILVILTEQTYCNNYVYMCYS